jgi:Na+:H+ antiporter, NhaA family
MENKNAPKIEKITPIRQVKDIYLAIREFIHLEVSGGIILLAAAVVAIIWANSPWSGGYFALWNTSFNIGFGNYLISHDLHWWINDALMVFFFLVVGLEIKREILVGELSTVCRTILPVAAAFGGMLFPALIYLLFNFQKSGMSGWGIPIATDIAFALGVMTLVGRRLPIGLKIFLTAVAIVDDVGAILVIAIFYSNQISWIFLLAAGIILILLLLANLVGIRSIFVYMLLGICLWFAILNSGIHATIAGVLIALFIPVRRKIQRNTFLEQATSAISAFMHGEEDHPRLLTSEQREAIKTLNSLSEETQVPSQRLEHTLHPWVTFAIMPLFALANAGISFNLRLSSLILSPISLGIIAGLVLGKQVGISLATWITVKLNLADLPEGVTWRQIYATGWLAGIGFTMSLFISELAFTSNTSQEAAKIGILIASLITGLIGYTLLRLSIRSKDHQ